MTHHIHHIAALLLLAACALTCGLIACSSDDIEDTAGGNSTAHHTFTIPLAIAEERTTASRATGDPGIDPEPHAPATLYIWADVTLADPDGSNEEKAVLFQTYNPAPDRWEYINDDPLHPDDRYRLAETARVVFDIGKQLLKPGTTVNIYAVATDFPLAISTALQEEKQASNATLLGQIRTLTLDLAGWCATTPALHSAALGNLYSNPLPLKTAHASTYPASGTAEQQLTAEHAGIYLADALGGINENAAPTRLYHCAAKADFKWEVAVRDTDGALDDAATRTLQRNTAVASVILSGLPTQLNVFTPTQNPAGTATCRLLAPTEAVHLTTPGNQWIGREYAYVLQPPTTAATTDGIITYGVTFSNPAAATPVRTAVSGAKTDPATNTTFTTWYRINARVGN